MSIEYIIHKQTDSHNRAINQNTLIAEIRKLDLIQYDGIKLDGRLGNKLKKALGENPLKISVTVKNSDFDYHLKFCVWLSGHGYYSVEGATNGYGNPFNAKEFIERYLEDRVVPCIDEKKLTDANAELKALYEAYAKRRNEIHTELGFYHKA